MSSKYFPVAAGNLVLAIACVVFMVCVLLHLQFAEFFSGVFASASSEFGKTPNSIVFGAIGGVFLLLTFAAHIWTVRGLSARPDVAPGGEKQPTIAPATLLIPMAIRFAGTFAILGMLLICDVVSRQEAVFDVLFWYVTLTTLEVAGIVWTFRSLQTHETTSRMSDPDPA